VLTPIEDHLRDGDDPNEWILVIRGRPLTVDGLLTAAARTLAEFSWHGEPMAAVSAEVTGPDRTTDDVLAGPRLRTRRTYASAPVAELVNAGFPVLATFTAPHVSIVLPHYDEAHVQALVDILGPERTNPYYLRAPR
jgi:hypothetical protein